MFLEEEIILNRVLGVIYLFGSVIWLSLMIPVALALGVSPLFGGLEKLFGDIGYWEYPVIILNILFSLLLAYLTFKFGISLVKSSWFKLLGKADSKYRFRSSFRNRHEQT